MVAYSFKRQFRAPILALTKRQTIRADRKRHARPREEMQLYTGMRTRQCQIIGTATCERVAEVRIGVTEGWYSVGGEHPFVSPPMLNSFAIRDGFSCWTEMRDFWLAEHPDTPVFSGVLIRWTNFVSGKAA